MHGGVTRQWLSPSACVPPHRVTHPEKVQQLAAAFRDGGWDVERPALVGYPHGKGVQLLSGSHRWAAAISAGIRIPVRVVPYARVVWAWGDLERWGALMGEQMGERA